MEEDEEEVEGAVLGYGCDDVSVMYVFSHHVTVSVLPISYILFGCSYPRTFFLPCLSLSLKARHIQECFKKKRGRKQKLIKPQQEKSRHEDRRKKISIIVLANLVIGFCALIPLEAGADGSEEQDTATVTKENENQTEEKPAAKQNRDSW